MLLLLLLKLLRLWGRWGWKALPGIRIRRRMVITWWGCTTMNRSMTSRVLVRSHLLLLPRAWLSRWWRGATNVISLFIRIWWLWRRIDFSKSIRPAIRRWSYRRAWRTCLGSRTAPLRSWWAHSTCSLVCIGVDILWKWCTGMHGHAISLSTTK